MDVQIKFKEFILNDIFWFDKSELNFGIYKIFRQKEKFISEKLEEIVSNINQELLSSNQSSLEIIKKELKDGYVPPKLELETIEQIKSAIEKYCNGSTQTFLEKLKASQNEEIYDSTKVYEYLYQFFNLYYEKGDFGYTPRSFKTYTIPYLYEEYLTTPETKISTEGSHNIDYKGEETLFTWKTKDSYYIKSNKFLNSVTLNLAYKNQNYSINTNILEKDEDIKDDKKVKQYRLITIKKENKRITLNFNISDHATPKHTIYLSMLSVIDEDIKELDYNKIFKDKKLKEFFEKLPFKDEKVQTSLLDENQSKLQKAFKKLLLDENLKKYIFDKDKNIFKYELSGEEDKTQLKSKTSKLMISKKEYASKVYTATKAKEFLALDKKDKFEFEESKDLEKLYEKDDLLDFFYRLDKGINLFYAGVDSDYFIHKNLKKFLSVELDKFIKNYIFADTDAILLMDESAKKIATFARVFKQQANIFIDLLSSIEEFQKYIWEKRKMVKSSNFVISSNKIKDTAILNKVLENPKQIKEWEDLGIIKKLEKKDIIDLQSHSYPIDTKHFDSVFKYQILSQFENIEKEISGLLIKSENYQALKFLEPKYTDKRGDGKIKCIYIDPPYNTGNDGFVYKDSFKSASWLSMMNDRLRVAKKLMREDGVIFTSIDNNESNSLPKLYENNNFLLLDRIALQVKAQSGDSSKLSTPFTDLKEDVYYCSKTSKYNFAELDVVKEYIDEKSNTVNQYMYLIKSMGSIRKTKDFSFDIDKGKTEINVYKVDGFNRETIPMKNRNENYYLINIDKITRTAAFSGEFKKQFSEKKDDKYYFEYTITRGKNKGKLAQIYVINGEQLLFLKDYTDIIIENGHKRLVKIEKLSNIWTDISYTGIANEGNVELKNGKKPEKLIQRIINLSIEQDKEEIVLDFFGGSGTTAAVSYKMNKKFISCEMNDYFESKMLNRMKYTMFGNSGGITSQKESGVVQYIELEQYDDIIDNLELINGLDYSKIPFGYIYEPDKNQINFRMSSELNNPLSETSRFDVLSSFIFHEGMSLVTVDLEDEILEVIVIDKYEKECMIILGNDKKKVEEKIDSIEEKYYKIYSNVNCTKSEQILAETFKGK